MLQFIQRSTLFVAASVKLRLKAPVFTENVIGGTPGLTQRTNPSLDPPPKPTPEQLHPDYGFAMFNLGVSLMINRDFVGAVLALERSLALEPRSTKIMVYLGKAGAESRVAW